VGEICFSYLRKWGVNSEPAGIMLIGCQCSRCPSDLNCDGGFVVSRDRCESFQFATPANLLLELFEYVVGSFQ
jgi:hypothetical protein